MYDNLNRLSAGFYQRDDNPSAKEYFEKMDYDLNGNITHLKRSAYVDQGNPAGIIDILAYAYTGNRLNTVTDSSTDYRGYPDTSGSLIEYDNNGNINHYEDKGILNINYNYLNLPSNIIFYKALYTRLGVKRENTSYLYRADGIKLRKTYNYAPFNPSGTVTQLKTKTTEYLDGFQYESGEGAKGQTIAMALKFIPTAEGYYNFENNKYIYNYTDHLGNVRLSYFHNGSSIEVLEESNYYPFGVKHEGYNTLAGNSAYQYKYNGKELQETGMYDYGARFYMPDIGRWGVIDNMSEKYRRHSPYNYAINNPIKFTDPDGNDPLYGEEAQAFFRQLQNSISSKPTDDITVNKKGIISNISRNNKPNRFFDESGKQLFFNDSQQDDKYMLSQYFEVNDRLYYPISDSDLKTQVTNVHHNNQLILMNGMDNWGSKFNSYIDLFLNSYNFVPGKGSDFTYSFLVPFLKNKNVNITNENLQDKFIPNAFFKFDNVNMIYNTFDAGNFMWGAWTKYIGLSAEKAMWGARMNEFGSDSSRDQNALWRGNIYFYKGTYKK